MRAVNPDDHAVLCIAIVEAMNGQRRRRPFVHVRRRGRGPLAVFVVRSDAAAQVLFDDTPTVLLLVFDPDLARAPGSQTLKALFGLTTREAECACLLMRGLTVGQAARELGVRPATVRTFLAHMTAKTDSRTQSELLARLLAVHEPLTEL